MKTLFLKTVDIANVATWILFRYTSNPVAQITNIMYLYSAYSKSFKYDT